jgi:nucleoside-diphosphate-sugar epimerase
VSVADFDNPLPGNLEFPPDYTVLYTIPPPVRPVDDRLENLLAAMDPAPARFVYISTSGVYGDRRGQLTDESVAAKPATDRSRRRLASELLLTQWCADTDCRLVILRSPAIYGPDRLGLDRIRNGESVLAERDAHPGNRIHVDDLVSCCIAALRDDVPAGLYNVGDGDYRSASWFAGKVAELAGLRPPPEISREQATRSFSSARLSFLNESRRLDITKMREILGVAPRDPETGIRDSVS